MVPRPADIYTAMPSLTGKVELEYEGELRGTDTVARDVIRQAIAKVFKKYFDGVPLQSVVQWFELGGTLRYSPNSSSDELFHQFKKIQDLLEKTQGLGIKAKDDPALLAAGGEFILEGLYALKRSSRNEELGYHTERRPPERLVAAVERLLGEPWQGDGLAATGAEIPAAGAGSRADAVWAGFVRGLAETLGCFTPSAGAGPPAAHR